MCCIEPTATFIGLQHGFAPLSFPLLPNNLSRVNVFGTRQRNDDWDIASLLEYGVVEYRSCFFLLELDFVNRDRGLMLCCNYLNWPELFSLRGLSW